MFPKHKQDQELHHNVIIFTGPKPHQSDQWAHKEVSGDSSTSDEGVMLSTADLPQGMTLTVASGEQDKDAHATEDFLMQPPTPLMGQEEPFVVEAPDGYIFRYFVSTLLAYALEAVVTFRLRHGTDAHVQVGKSLALLVVNQLQVAV